MISPNANTWTNPTKVYWPSVTVNYQSGAVAYPANDSGSTAFSGSGQTAYVTIYDPGKVGGSQPIHVDSTEHERYNSRLRLLRSDHFADGRR